MRPMLATRGDHVPAGAEWLHEVKWDGMRVLVEVDDRLRVWSRNENDVTAAWPDLAGVAEAVPPGTLLDGEVVALEDGRPSFARLADRMHVRSAARAAAAAASNPVTLVAFDLLRLAGTDLTDRPLSDRRARLEDLALDAAGVSVHVPPAYDDGAVLLDATEQQGLEGVVSKRRTSRYHPGQRSKDWLKFPHRAVTSYVVGGWRPETGGTRLGALLVGQPAPAGLVFRGRVGSGVAGRAGVRLADLLAPLDADDCPFADAVPRVDAAGARWVRPRVVVDVAALGTTGAGRLRQPAFVGVRPDLDPEDLT